MLTANPNTATVRYVKSARFAAGIALTGAVEDVREEKRLTMASLRRQVRNIHSQSQWGAFTCPNRDALRRNVFAVRWDQPGHDGAKAAALAAIAGYATTHPTELADEAAAEKRAQELHRLQARVRVIKRIARDRVRQAMASFAPTDAEAVKWMTRRGHDPATYRDQVVAQVLAHYEPKIAKAEAELAAFGGAP